jgi:penicillin-binding protein 1A
VVLDKMAQLAMISPAEAEAAKATPLGLQAAGDRSRYAAPHFVERVKRFVLDDPRFGETPLDRRNLLFGGGLRIDTTRCRTAQAQAEAAVGKVLSRPERDPAAAVVTIDPRNGHVRALVGGRDFFGGGADAKFDLATQGRRPAGSAFKPFVLAAALKKGISLDRVYRAPSRITIPLGRGQGVWPVDNYEGSGGGRLSLWEATIASSNTVYAQLIMDVGPEAAIETAAEMGVRSPLKPYPSAVLGTNDVTVLDMASAYGTLANRGLATPPTFVTRITTSSGRVLYRHQAAAKRVLSSSLVADEVAVLQQVVNRGTGVNARIGRPVAGKTGTGQQWRDAWFVGFTPELVTAVWVGFPNAQRSMVPPVTRRRVTGGSWPAEIWQLYMAEHLAAAPMTPFPMKPPPTTTIPPPDPGAPSRFILDNVVGMPAADGQAFLERQGFRVVTRIVPNGEYPPGYVVGQTPKAGASVREGATISLQISEVAHYAPVPDVLGQTARDAKSMLEAAGFYVKLVYEREPPVEGVEPVPGSVWKQNPLAGSMALEKTVVRVWVNP